MLILHSRKLVFVHISKCAGMWATRVLESQAQSGDYILSGPNGRFVGAPMRSRLHNAIRGVRRRLGQDDVFKHSSAAEIARAWPKAWSEYESVAILRDPAARLVSMLRDARQTRGIPTNRGLADIFKKLREMEDPNDFILSGSFDGLLIERFFKPQSDFVLDPSGREMVGRLLNAHQLETQIRAICDVPEALCGKRVNASDGALVLTEKARSRIEKLYAADLALIDRVAPRWSQA